MNLGSNIESPSLLDSKLDTIIQLPDLVCDGSGPTTLILHLLSMPVLLLAKSILVTPELTFEPPSNTDFKSDALDAPNVARLVSASTVFD